jgi:hypothetical protein
MTNPLSSKKMTLGNMARWVECRPIGDQLAAVENLQHTIADWIMILAPFQKISVLSEAATGCPHACGKHQQTLSQANSAAPLSVNFRVNADTSLGASFKRLPPHGQLGMWLLTHAFSVAVRATQMMADLRGAVAVGSRSGSITALMAEAAVSTGWDGTPGGSGSGGETESVLLPLSILVKPTREARARRLEIFTALLASDSIVRQASVAFSQAMAWLYHPYSLAKAGILINFSRVRLNSLSTNTSFSSSPKMKVTAPLRNWSVAAR